MSNQDADGINIDLLQMNEEAVGHTLDRRSVEDGVNVLWPFEFGRLIDSVKSGGGK